jgi:hypothetical protein
LDGTALHEYTEEEARRKVNRESRRNKSEYEDEQAALCLMELPYLWVSVSGRHKEDSEHAEQEEMLDRWTRMETANAQTGKRIENLEIEMSKLTRGVTALIGSVGSNGQSTTSLGNSRSASSLRRN